MKNVIKFITFFTYTIGLFWIQDIQILLGIFGLQIVFMLLCRVSIQDSIKSILSLMPFILFTVLIDIWVMGLIEAVQIGIRLMMVCNITYIFGKTMSAMEIAKAMEHLFFPLKWIGVNTKNIRIMISIAITFIPIIKQEIQNIKYSLLAKGFDMHWINQIKHFHYMMGPLFYSLLRKVREMEEALMAKGYREE